MQMMKRLMTQYMPGMLTCHEVDGFLFDFHEGKLSYSENLKFKLHLTLCKECKAYLKNYKNTVRITQSGDIYNKSASDTLENIPEELVQVIIKSRSKS
jgi:hypothetical protein